MTDQQTTAINSIFTKEELEFAIHYFTDDMNSLDELNKKHDEFKVLTAAYRAIARNNPDELKRIDKKEAEVEAEKDKAMQRFVIAQSIVVKCKTILAEKHS